MWVLLYLMGSVVHLAWAFCFPVQKGPHGTTVCGLEDGHFIESLSTYQLLLNLLKSTRQYGFPPQQFNDGSGSGMSNRWWQVMFTVHFLFVGMTWWLVVSIKDPWSALQPSGYWKIVHYSFCKSPLEIVVVLSICILLISHLHFVFCFVVLHYRPFIVLSFTGTKFDILGHTMLHPICGVLYIFYYINLVLPTFCCRVAALIVDKNMYTCLVWLCCSVI